MTRSWRLVGLVVGLTVVLVACTPASNGSPRPHESPLPTPGIRESPLSTPEIRESPIWTPEATYPPAALEAGTGAVRGRVPVESLSWADREVYVYACPFTGTEEEGFYVLEPSVHPSTTVSPDGSFQLVNVPAGTYVLVAGPSPEEAIAFQERGRAKIYHLESGQVLDLDEVSLR